MDERVSLPVPLDMALTKPSYVGWPGLIFQVYVKLNAERWEHRIFVVESLLLQTHQQSPLAGTKVTVLAISRPGAHPMACPAYLSSSSSTPTTKREFTYMGD